MQYAISVLQAGITALERAGINDHRVIELKKAIEVLSHEPMSGVRSLGEQNPRNPKGHPL